MRARRRFVREHLLWLLAAVQVGHVALFVAVPSARWAAAFPPKKSDHQCLPAYLHAAELAPREPSAVYDPTRFAGDLYQYPPQFLLAPAAVLAVAPDAHAARLVWLTLSVAAFTAFAWQAARAREPDGPPRRAVTRVAAALAALPVLQSLQYGQAHLVVIAAGVGAMLLFARGRDAPGGFLLAAATLAKLFPGVLLVVLVARRRWRALAWTAGWAAALTAATALVFGPALLVEFARTHLPALVDGRAFAPHHAEPSYVTDSLSLQALPSKLLLLAGAGAGADDAAAPVRAVGPLALLAALVAAVWMARRDPRGADAREGTHALALLALASLVGPYLPAPYGMAPFVWLLALAAPALTPGVAAAWLALSLLPFLDALPLLWRHGAAIGLAGTLAALATLAWGWRPRVSFSPRREGAPS